MRSLQVLIADDFEHSRQTIKKMLISLGIDKIDITSTGKGVVDACRAKQYDLILCDFNLGIGKNGQQALEEVRSTGLLKSTGMFVIISAETSRDIVMSIMEENPDAYLAKPFTSGVLKERIEKLLQQNDELRDIKEAEDGGNYKRVIALCIELINQGSKHSSWCKRKMADTFFSTGQLAKAQSICRSVQETNPVDWAMVIEAKVMKTKGFIDDAISYLQRAMKLFPSCMQAYDLAVQYFEEKGFFHEAQKILQSALRLSPSVVSRQQSLVDISLSNGDLDTALKASQQTLRLSVNSVHASAKQYLQAGQVISESIFEDDTNESRKKGQDAFNLLNQVSKKFPNDKATILEKVLIESRVYSSQGKMSEANDALKEAQQIIEEQPNILTPDIMLEMGKALYVAGSIDEADRIFSRVVMENQANKSLVAKTYAFVDEPVGRTARAEAKKYNLLGLALYGEHKYEDALDAFIKAQNSSPKHPGLNMNLAQTTFKLMADKNSDQGKKAELVNLCSDSLNRIKHISDKHQQYQRYKSLQNYAARHLK